MICTFPHNIYGYMIDSYEKNESYFYNVTLGLQWAQYFFNILMHIYQKDQIWNAYIFYVETKLCNVLNKNKPFNERKRKETEKTEKSTDNL